MTTFGLLGTELARAQESDNERLCVKTDAKASGKDVYVTTKKSCKKGYRSFSPSVKTSSIPQGPAGEPGAKGDKGDKGDTGAVGPQGAEGIPGAIGPRGEKGEKGDKGEAGATGVAGAAGVQGPKGDKGETGPAGAAGPQGPVGPQGPAGSTGAQGAKGDPGLVDPALCHQITEAKTLEEASGIVAVALADTDVSVDATCGADEFALQSFFDIARTDKTGEANDLKRVLVDQFGPITENEDGTGRIIGARARAHNTLPIDFKLSVEVVCCPIK